MLRFRALIMIGVLTIGGIFLVLSSFLRVRAGAATNMQVTPTQENPRLAQPPTVYPPVQADNGAQTYWGMCMSCHGDQAQGLTEEWRTSFSPTEGDCWQAGCHSGDAPKNSFMIPQTGAPALAGAGRLSRFSNTFELRNYIQQNMPYFRAGSLTSEDAWSLTAYILRLNGKQAGGLILSDTNGAAIPVHHVVKAPTSEIPGTLILVGVLILAAIGWNRARAQGARALPAKSTFFHHLHPPTISAEQAEFRYTLAAGGLGIFFSLILLLTGLLEMYYYVPTPGQAAGSIQTINSLVPFGRLIRNLHFWSAQFLVIVMTLHLLRVVLTGAYAGPRRFNHLLGLGLLVVILLLDFTGYILRWDEGIHWALVVGANLLKTIPWIGEGIYQFVIGGSEPGAATLTRFYAWHIFGLTLGAGILMVWHAFRVRRDGGIALPPPAARPNKARITRVELLKREVLAMLIIGSISLLFSLIVPAPIAAPISDASIMTGESQAPWFFLWIQQLLKTGDPFLFGVLAPVLVIAALGLMPYWLPNAKPEELGRWFPRGNRLAQVLTVTIISAILVLTILGAIAK